MRPSLFRDMRRRTLVWSGPQFVVTENVMPLLSRTGVSLDEDLLKEFRSVDYQTRRHPDRWEAIRDLIREALLTKASTRISASG